ncbi:Uncharacterised protein [uncultured archaeon]|nr:Uncharacterised protein [uncultured archaeon]
MTLDRSYLTEKQLELLVDYRWRGVSPDYIARKFNLPTAGLLNLESQLRDFLRVGLRAEKSVEQIALELGYSPKLVTEFGIFYNLIQRPEEELPKEENPKPAPKRRRSSLSPVLNPFSWFRFR